MSVVCVCMHALCSNIKIQLEMWVADCVKLLAEEKKIKVSTAVTSYFSEYQNLFIVVKDET